MNDHEISLQRLRVFLREIVEPAVYPRRASLDVRAALVADPRRDPPTPREAQGLSYRVVRPGWSWGPRWATCWFRLTGRVPDEFEGGRVVLRFSSGTEALLWERRPGEFVPARGFDVHRDSVRIRARAGERIDALIEAACNHPFGVTGFEWDDPEVHRRWSGDHPGRLELAEVAIVRPLIEEFSHAFAFALELAHELSPTDRARTSLLASLERAERTFLLDRTEPGARSSLEELGRALSTGAANPRTTCLAVGHAHLDTAWLWPIRETKRKCLRTFSNVLSLMEDFPDLGFLCSQAQHYAWVEEASPAMFTRIRERVRQGRWEPQGAMWVEPDLNVPGGESLVRQIQHAHTYWHSRFGARARQRMLFLPDTFGFPASIPQLMLLAGLDLFVTNKLHWNSTNPWAHATWRWRGIDGSEVLAHNTPGADYNAVNTPRELRRGLRHAERTSAVDVWLQPFGFGDGGGGPTPRSVRYARHARACARLPAVRLGSVREFAERLHAEVRVARRRGRDVPVWEGELYLELHRGTLTTQGWIKRANREGEHALLLGELLGGAGPDGPARWPRPARARLHELWRLLLLNQFHDILPGSSIAWVYEDARRDFRAIEQGTRDLGERALRRWTRALDSRGLTRPVRVVNPSGFARREVVEVDGAPAWIDATAPLGVSLVELRRGLPPGIEPAAATARSLSNGRLEARLDEDGRIVSLRRPGARGSEVCARPGRLSRALNQLVIYHDLPHRWDAWDIDAQYESCPLPGLVHPPDSIRVVSRSELRAEVEVERRIGEASRMTQTYRLDAGSPRLDVVSRVEWRESHKLLRALFPTSIRTGTATCDIQFGFVERPTRPRTPRDKAKFEFCAHRFVDLSMPGRGLALLNNCKYGHSCRDGTLGISLLRAPKHPDAQADMGAHEFVYSLMPHAGDWRGAGVIDQGEALNRPLLARGWSGRSRGALGRAWGPLDLRTTSGPGRAVVSSVGAGEGDSLEVRVHEAHGLGASAEVAWNLPVTGVRAVDLLHRPLTGARVDHDRRAGITRIRLRAFEIVTLEATLARGRPARAIGGSAGVRAPRATRGGPRSRSARPGARA